MSSGIGQFCHQIDRIYGEIKQGQYLKEAGEFVRSAAVLRASKFSGYLKDNIFVDFEGNGNHLSSVVHTEVSYAKYVELGTGQKGAENHSDISPEVTPVYRTSPWWIHESQIDIGAAETYGWFYIDTPDGRFYQCTGQPARPFMYPALKDHEDDVMKIVQDGVNKILKGAGK